MRESAIMASCIFIFTKILERYVEGLLDNLGDVLDEKESEWVFAEMYGNLKVEPAVLVCGSTTVSEVSRMFAIRLFHIRVL
jgi:hypothetical protein